MTAPTTDEPPLRVLILGGYGTFGGRLAVLLADEPRLTLFIAGRSLEGAERFCAGLGGRVRAVPLRASRESVEEGLAQAQPDILVDATGPFQAYGPDPYGVVRACLARGVNYVDLADGAAFVEGIVRFDEEARTRGVFVLSGMSSFPVLTAAVADDLAQGLDRVDAIIGGIAPSPYAGVGRNVIRAIAGYAGQPIRIRRGGRDGTAFALTESRNYTIAPPGRVPLRTTRFSLVEVPDLAVLPRRFPGVDEVWMGAGPVPELLHRCLNSLAWLVRLRVLPSLAALAPIMDRVINVVRWGEHRGGMFVVLRGTMRDGAAVERSWHLLAEGADGPLIPSMAAEAIVRNTLQGRRPRTGARSGDGELSLADYDALFARRATATGRRSSADEAAATPLFKRLLGDAWHALPEALRAFHGAAGKRTYRGRAQVERGGGLFARMIGRAFRFPSAGEDVPVTVEVSAGDGQETWRRDFGGRRFVSHHVAGRDRSERLLCERFGPVAIGIALATDADRLRFVVRRWSVLGLPLPRAWAPGGESFETEEGGRFRFDVTIAHPLAGLIVRYRGWLELRDSGSAVPLGDGTMLPAPAPHPSG